jgi:Sulfotransferase family
VTFPNLFIIGAMKSGTSSLHEYLHQHPEIFMARMKEPQYFAPHRTRWGQWWGQGHPHPHAGMQWYLDLFKDAGDVKYAGESSVSYTAAPWVTGCEKRIHAFNPEARPIYIMRNPVERALSHYWHFVNDGREDLPPLEAIRRKEAYVARSDYARQLRPYLETFGREQVYALTLEELEADPAGTLRRLFMWLQVDPDVRVTIERFNVGKSQMRQTRRHLVPLDTLRKHWRWKRLEAYMPAPVPRLLERITYRPIERGAMATEGAVDHLRDVLAPKVRELSLLLGREFPEWTI